jgi:hypothetical protein
MGEAAFMQQIEEKISEGFTCVKQNRSNRF